MTKAKLQRLVNKYYPILPPEEKKLSKMDLKKYGLTFRWKNDKFVECLISKSDGLFIKRNVFLAASKPRLYTVPTIKKGGWVFQPICDTRNGDKAFEILMERYNTRTFDWCDATRYNCGFLDGKPVIFDW